MQRGYDHLVVGGGTAGVVTAVRLAQALPDARIGLLEAGPTDAGDERVLRARRWMELLGGELDYDYAIERSPRGNELIRHSRARVLGGCSSHNSVIAFRAPDRDLDHWVARGAAGWGPADCAPAFARVCSQVHVTETPVRNPVNEAVIAAAEQAGLPRVRFNDGAFTEGVGWLPLALRDGIRQSSSVAYLHAPGPPPNLDVVTDTRALRLVLERGRAAGVDTPGGRVRVAGETILACGAFDSPKLLLLSGIGPQAQLRAAGVDVAVDLPAVGAHLLDHPEGVVNWETRRAVPAETAQLFEVGVFARTEPGARHPDVMLHVGLIPFTVNTALRGYPTAEHGISLTPNVCRARSEGSVRLRSADPRDPPRIDFRYFADPYDERVMLAGVALAREIAAQPALRGWIARELTPGVAVTAPAALSEYTRSTANTVYHPAGTCRMGAADDPDAVVDPALRVRGVDALRVADASVFPSLTSVNPMLTVMMIGERAAELVTA